LAQNGGASSSNGPTAPTVACHTECLPKIPPPSRPPSDHDFCAGSGPAVTKSCTSDGVTRGGQSSHASSVSDGITEPVCKKPCTLNGIVGSNLVPLSTGNVVASVEKANSIATDQWAAWQDRKRRKLEAAQATIVEGEFARLARLAASEC
jgi:hypothetical protein